MTREVGSEVRSGHLGDLEQGVEGDGPDLFGVIRDALIKSNGSIRTAHERAVVLRAHVGRGALTLDRITEREISRAGTTSSTDVY